jgi:hypothetical protein
MTNFPDSLDDDTTLPIVNNNITELGGEAIDALRDAVFAIEQNIGIGAAGTAGDIATRIGVAFYPDGSLKPSAITSLGLVTLPITEDQIANFAQIPESKLKLDFKTQDLFNYIKDLTGDINVAISWISLTGVKLEPHLLGALYRHTLDQIDVTPDPVTLPFLENKFRQFRNNDHAYFLISDMNTELLEHQWADGSPATGIQNVVTNDGSTYPSNYGHTASGIFLNSSRFFVIPQTTNDLQALADFIDSASIFLYGTRIQNLYSNGISRISRSASLITDGYGQPIIPPTPAIAYLLNTGGSSSPVDDINTGDDIIEFVPDAADVSSNAFDAKFALVKIGDIIRINYGTVEVPFVIKEKKYTQSGGNKKYVVRIAGKNLFYSATAVARIDKPLFNDAKWGALAIAPVNNEFAETPSLIVSNPRGAVALGNEFNPDQLDGYHYMLYLALFPTGNPSDGYTILPGIDVTGNLGVTAGKYTLDSVVTATNAAFRANGYNYRFIAFSYQGQFGVMLADSYNNTGFSILSAVVASDGSYDSLGTETSFPNNVVDVFPTGALTLIDPLGFGVGGSAVASPPYMTTYGSAEASLLPTKLFVPLKRNNYYVNGIEREKLTLEVDQSLDGYGDGYWTAVIQTVNVFPGPGGHVQTTYRVNLDLSTSNLKAGKTLVVQSLGESGLVDYGRFIIESVTFTCSPSDFTDITVYDSVHATGTSPSSTLGVGATVALYFNSDSVSFNAESATDPLAIGPFKRHFEVYIDQDGKTFTHERSRINIRGGTLFVGAVPLYTYSELAKLDILKVSPKLRGYQFGSVNKITLHVSLNATVGAFDGYLCSFDGTNYSHIGPDTIGFFGQTTRIYDESTVDYIDILFDIDQAVSTFNNQNIDFQLFPTLSLDDEVMMIATCQVNDTDKTVTRLRDERQFGNTSEKDLTTSALDFINLGDKELHTNGVIRGFDVKTDNGLTNPNGDQIYLNGGTVLVNGKLIQMNAETVSIPIVQELYSASLYNINWAVCVNDKGEYQTIPITDYDPILGTPNGALLRIFVAHNPITVTDYNIESTNFVNIVGHRRDLALLYMVASTVTGTTTSLTVNDARRYVSNVNSVDPIVLSSDTVSEDAFNGNFRDLDAALIWIKYSRTFNSLVKLRGVMVFDEAIDLTGFDHRVEFVGEGATLELVGNNGITIGNNVTLRNLNFVYGPPISFSDGYIHGGNGCIYANLATDDLSNIVIEKCNFSMNDPLNPAHPPFISFEINRGFTLKDVTIRDNKFADSVGNSKGHTAICIAHNLLGSGTDPAAVKNILIENNDCDDQMIIVSSFASNVQLLTGLGLACFNVNINNNSCGVIGVIPSLTPTLVDDLAIPRLVSITRNTCKLISALDAYFGFTLKTSVAAPTYGIGNIIASGNACNWVHLAGSDQVADTHYANLKIVDNTLTANDATFLNDFYAFLGSAFNIAIRTLAPFGTTNEKNSAIISGNTLDSGIYGGITYTYAYGIAGTSSSIISNNIIRGLTAVSSVGIAVGLNSGISTPSRQYTITNNQIFRGANTIVGYVFIVGSAGDSALCVDNYFDGYTIDNVSNTAVVFVSGAINTVVERNINQTVAARVPASAGQIGIRASAATFEPVVAGVAPNITASFVQAQQDLNFQYKDHTVHQKVNWMVPLNGTIPPNCQLISASASVFVSVAGGTTEDANLWFVNSPLGPSTFSNVTLTVSPQTLSKTNTLAYSSNPDEGTFIVLEFDILHATLDVLATASNGMVITYRW